MTTLPPSPFLAMSDRPDKVVYFVKSRYTANGRFKHLSDVKPYSTIGEAAEKVAELGGPNKYLAIYDDRGHRYEHTSTGHWRK
jgi:hypothetical protein